MYLKTRLTVAVASMALSVESSTLELHDSSTFNDLSCETNFTNEPNSTKMDEVDYESLPTDRLSVHLVAGGAAGVMEHCVMYPVDCVKVSVSVQTGVAAGLKDMFLPATGGVTCVASMPLMKMHSREWVCGGLKTWLSRTLTAC